MSKVMSAQHEQVVPNISINVHADAVDRTVDDSAKMREELILLAHSIKENKRAIRELVRQEHEGMRRQNSSPVALTKKIKDVLGNGSIDMKRFDLNIDDSELETDNVVTLDLIPNGKEKSKCALNAIKEPR